MNTIGLFISKLIFFLLPDTRCFPFKRFLLRMSGVNIGTNVRICSSTRIMGSADLIIGDNTWIGHDDLIIASGNITIGNNVNIAPRVYIGAGTHEIDPDGTSVAGKGMSLPIRIGDGSWICAHASIIAGVTIGKKSIIAAGAVVTKDVPDEELWGGVPAIFIKKLKV